MMTRWLMLVAVLTSLGVGAPVRAQSSLEAHCDHPAVGAAGARDACLAAAQAAISAQPALGLAIAGGNSAIGYGSGGLRVGVMPRVSTGLRLNAVSLKLPDLVADQLPGQTGSFGDRYGAVIPALTGDLTLSLTTGQSINPGLGGIGAITLLGSATYLPFDLFTDDFDEVELAYGIGARIGLLNESFVAPAVSISIMWQNLGQVTFGDICPTGLVGTSGDLFSDVEVGACAGGGDSGEIGFDLTTWSGRATVSKHHLGIGGLLGIGFDSLDSDLDFGFRSAPAGGSGGTPIFRVRSEQLESTRWMVFGNLSYRLLAASLTVEAGWQHGVTPIAGFRDLDSNFDPKRGTLFGGVGVRLAL